MQSCSQQLLRDPRPGPDAILPLPRVKELSPHNGGAGEMQTRMETESEEAEISEEGSGPQLEVRGWQGRSCLGLAQGE